LVGRGDVALVGHGELPGFVERLCADHPVRRAVVDLGRSSVEPLADLAVEGEPELVLGLRGLAHAVSVGIDATFGTRLARGTSDGAYLAQWNRPGFLSRQIANPEEVLGAVVRLLV